MMSLRILPLSPLFERSTAYKTTVSNRFDPVRGHDPVGGQGIGRQSDKRPTKPLSGPSQKQENADTKSN
jgi:hypothetical protein